MNLEGFRRSDRHWSVGGISALYVLYAWKHAGMGGVKRGSERKGHLIDLGVEGKMILQ